MSDDKVPLGGRGGNRHPIAVFDFILSHLGRIEEDYIANVHRAYCDELERLARERGRRSPYHRPSYHSFQVKFLHLVRAGEVEFSGREEASDSAQGKVLSVKPIRRYYRLKK